MNERAMPMSFRRRYADGLLRYRRSALGCTDGLAVSLEPRLLADRGRGRWHAAEGPAGSEASGS